MLRTSWIPGPATDHSGEVFVSVTDFTVHRKTDLLPAYLAGRRLASGWNGLDGAVGLWLWAELSTGRCGSVSFWLDRKSLHGFVGWAPHIAIMRKFRDKGVLVSDGWTSERFDRDEAWRKAALRTRH
jgi:hypothetical protein